MPQEEILNTVANRISEAGVPGVEIQTMSTPVAVSTQGTISPEETTEEPDDSKYSPRLV